MDSQGRLLPPDGKKARALLSTACKRHQEGCGMEMLIDFELKKGRDNWARQRSAGAKGR
jgi:hypothetical protein